MTLTLQNTNKTPSTVDMKKIFSDRVPKGFLYIGSNPKCLFFMMIYCVVISESMKQKTLLTGINS